MTKYRERITILIWLLVTCTIRVLFYLFDYTGVQDAYGLFDSAVIRFETGEAVPVSGLSFAYTNTLSHIIRFFHIDLSGVFIWQLLMELAALTLIVLAARNFWGIYSAIIIGILLSVSPILLIYLKICSPEEYFLFYFSIIFYVLSRFYAYSRRQSWFSSSLGELSVIAMGIYIGVLCIWNYMGFVSFAAVIVIVIKNYQILHDKAHLLEMTDGEVEEKNRIMNVFAQLLMLVAGTVIGGFVLLIRYTGFTGMTITEEFNWYCSLFRTFPKRTMDFDTYFALYLILSVVIGSVCGAVIHSRKKAKKTADAFIKEVEMVKGNDERSFFVTEDGRKVPFLDNPVPGPKQHEHRPMKFDLDEIEKENSDLVIFDERVDINYDSLRRSILDVENGESLGVRFDKETTAFKNNQLELNKDREPEKDPIEESFKVNKMKNEGIPSEPVVVRREDAEKRRKTENAGSGEQLKEPEKSPGPNPVAKAPDAPKKFTDDFDLDVSGDDDFDL